MLALTTDLMRERGASRASRPRLGYLRDRSGAGGALGIAVLGSHRHRRLSPQLALDLPPGVPPEAADAARDTLGAAVGPPPVRPQSAGASAGGRQSAGASPARPGRPGRRTRGRGRRSSSGSRTPIPATITMIAPAASSTSPTE